MNSANLVGKRVLITDFYFKDPRLFEEIVRVLSQEGVHIFALLNVKTFRDNFLTNYPRVIPIILNTFRNYETVNGKEKDVNNITFKGTRERKLMNNLPKVNHVINFAGPEFVEVFTQPKNRHCFSIVELEFSKIKPKLRSGSLITAKNCRTIIHIVPDIPIGNGIRQTLFGSTSQDEEEKSKHYVKAAALPQAIRDTPSPRQSHNTATQIQDSLLDLSPAVPADALTRLSVFRRSLSFRLRRSFATRFLGDTNLPANMNEQKVVLRDEEVEKLRNCLKDAYDKSMKKYETKRLKCVKTQEKKEQQIDKKVKELKEIEVRKNVQEAEKANAETQGRLSSLSAETVNKVAESRTRRAEKSGIAAAIRTYRGEIMRLETRFQDQLNDLKHEWYQEILKKQARVIRKINKAFIEKGIAARNVLENSSSQ